LTTATGDRPDEKPKTVRMSVDEAWQMLEASHSGVFTTLRRDGMPISLPVWFVVENRTIVIGTPTTAKKAVRVRRNPVSTFLVQSGVRWVELAAVHLVGRTELIDTTDEWLAWYDHERQTKYGAFALAREDMPGATRRAYEERGDRVYLRFIPDEEERLIRFDNKRLGLS
jgi:pyridoxine/pyridoxamine 5'-phosphate oxidase